MSWFQLDPQSLAERASSRPPSVPTWQQSIWRGVIGFTIVSLAGFVPWAFFGKWFREPGRGGELGMYLACAAVFLILSGALLHRLILGRGSFIRFYAVFTPAFIIYSAAWIAAWMLIGGHLGSILGLLVGTGFMGLMLTQAFAAQAERGRVIAALFILNSLGYFIGGWVEGWLIELPKCEFFGVSLARPQQRLLAMMSWGLFYGLGLGTGLGLAFHACQTRARELLARSSQAVP